MWLTLHQLVSCANLWHTCCQRHLWPLEAGRRHVRLSFRCGKILELFYLWLKHEYQHKPLPLGTQKLSMGQCGTFANLRALAGDLTKLTYPWVSTQSPGATVCNHRQEKDGGGVLPINVSPMSNCQHASMDKHWPHAAMWPAGLHYLKHTHK